MGAHRIDAHSRGVHGVVVHRIGVHCNQVFRLSVYLLMCHSSLNTPALDCIKTDATDAVDAAYIIDAANSTDVVVKPF